MLVCKHAMYRSKDWGWELCIENKTLLGDTKIGGCCGRG